MTLEEARQFALSLPETTEEPHFEMQSFRIHRMIFATVPPDGNHLHIFVDDLELHAAVAEHPASCQELWWGKRLAGVRVVLSEAQPELVFELLENAWRKRAPKKVLQQFDARQQE